MVIRLLLFALIGVSITLSFTLPSKYVSRTGHLHVESKNRFKNIVADNYQVYCEVIPASGKVTFKGLMKSFRFDFGALDQAFNSKRVNLNEFSKFTFEGDIINASTIKWERPGVYPVHVKGFLRIGGYKRLTEAHGNIRINGDGTLSADAALTIVIEEASVQTINKMMKERLPSMLTLDVDQLGISRNIDLRLKATYRPRG